LDDVGAYEQREFPESRTATLDTLDLGQRKHHIPILLELDVTVARDSIQSLKEKTNERLSFTGWIVKCIGQAVSEHKYVHAMRKGKRSLILFDDVDITVVVERVASRASLETLPMPYVIRKTNEKSVRVIHAEIRAAQAQTIENGQVQLGTSRSANLTRLFSTMPRFLRDWVVWRRLTSDPFFAKKTMGTVIVTSVGITGQGSGNSWGIPTGIHPLVIALGGIAKKPGVIGNNIEIREYLSMTVLFDHDVTDGAPVARFIQRLKELVESGYGLVEVTP
jgi:pyruvate/2-oxoglutarate dehydrogenase complex dihydrolipoamide acyltransferase (E2) component